jgi:quercetin dioxygenase-like cupin family protein
MKINRLGSQPAGKASPDNFYGGVRRDWSFAAPAPARIASSSVTFEPGARTAWHTHPLGQALFIVAGAGWVQVWGEPKQDVRSGDVVWFEPGEKHWHGGTATTAMTHIAVVENLDRKTADWMEHVTDEQFNG